LNFRGFAGSAVTRVYHLHQLPLFSRRLRVIADGSLSVWFGRDMADLGAAERSIGGSTTAGDKADRMAA
jgi:NADH:quinone reductase (non-electrogenic)